MARFEKSVYVDDDFVSELSPALVWYIGLMAADGCVRDNGSICLAQSGDHGLALIHHVQSLIGHNGKVCHAASTRQTSHSIYFRSEPYRIRLAEFGVVPRKTLTLTFPSQLPVDLLEAFLRGYIDGDGCVAEYGNGAGSRYLLISLVGTQEFIVDCNAAVPFAGHARRLYRARNLMELRWHGATAVRLGKWLWADTGLYQGPKYKQYAASRDNPTLPSNILDTRR